MKVAIVFHSVCGNTYMVAKCMETFLSRAGHQVTLKRALDFDWVEKPDLEEHIKRNLFVMRAVPEAWPRDLLEADVIVMGSPVYFGNVSAELKAFMDSTGGLWYQGKLIGKKFAAFVSAGNTEGGGDLALQSLHTYAKYMGMLSVPLSTNVLPGENINALGIIHYSNGKYSDSLDDKTVRLIERWSQIIV